MRYKIILLTITLILLFVGIDFVFALELQYPSLPKIGTIEAGTTIEKFIAYIYHIIITVCGILALGTMIYGGIEWLTSAGSPTRISEAKKRITHGLLGMVILLGSYLILYQINPKLTLITIEKKPPAQLITLESIKATGGVYFCTEPCEKTDEKCILENCELISGVVEIPAKYRGKDFTILGLGRSGAYNYIIFFDENPSGKHKFNRCGVWVDEGLVLAGQKQQGLSRKEASYVEVGKYPGLYQSEKVEVKFCERARCEKTKIKGKEPKEWSFSTYSDGNPQRMAWDKLNGSPIQPVRTMEMKGESYTLLFKNTNFGNECYLTKTNEWNLGANFMVGKDEDPKSETYGSPYTRLGSMILIPMKKKSAIVATGDILLKDEDARAAFQANGISINKDCIDPNKRYQDIPDGQTCFEGLPKKAVDGTIDVKKACEQYGCTITITSGSELGHEEHGPGRAVLDYRSTGSGGEALSNWILANSKPIPDALGWRISFDEKVAFFDERKKPGDPHWHVVFK